MLKLKEELFWIIATICRDRLKGTKTAQHREGSEKTR